MNTKPLKSFSFAVMAAKEAIRKKESFVVFLNKYFGTVVCCCEKLCVCVCVCAHARVSVCVSEFRALTGLKGGDILKSVLLPVEEDTQNYELVD